MWVEVLDGDGAGDRAEVPAGSRVVLGRARGCDLVVRDGRVSREHAVVEREGDVLLVRDLGSANGTWRGDRRVGEARLHAGDELRIGSTRLAARATAPTSRPSATPTPSVLGALLERSSRRAGRATAVAAAAVAAACVALLALVVVPSGGADRVPEVVAGARASVLRVEVQRSGARAATGSAWVLDAAAGLVVTAAHVLNEGDRFTAQLAGEQARPATVVGIAPCDDVALLRVGARGLRTLPMGSQARLAAGQAVVALGFSAAELTSTAGVVAAPRAALVEPAPDVPSLRDAVQTDTAIAPGSSGGPLVDLDGRLVGMNAVARTSTTAGRDVQGQNFAVGVERLRAVLDALRHGRPAGWTGLTFGYPDPDELVRRGLPSGVFVTGALRGEARWTGRLLVGIDGRPLRPALASVCEAMAGTRGTAALTLVAPGEGAARPEVVRVPVS